MLQTIILCIGINFVLFSIPLFVLFFRNNFYRRNEGKSAIAEDSVIALAVTFGFCYILIFSVTLGFLLSHKIELIYRFKNPLIILFFIVCLIVSLYFLIKVSLKLKNNIYRRNYKRKNNILEKLKLIKKYNELFTKRLDICEVEEEKDFINQVLSLLKSIEIELKISYSALDVNVITESFKDIEIESTSLQSLQREVDKIKAYRSLSEISVEIEDLMKKYDRK